MRVEKHSLLSRAQALTRFGLVRAWHGPRLVTDGVAYVGKDCRFYLGDETGTIRLGRRVHLSDQVTLESHGLLEVGDGTAINAFSRVVARERVRIGRNVTIAQFVSILDHDHGHRFDDGHLVLDGYTTRPIEIGDHVWLGDKCTVLKGVHVGENVIAGAHTLIHRDVPPNCVIAGAPFRVIRELHPHDRPPSARR